MQKNKTKEVTVEEVAEVEEVKGTDGEVDEKKAQESVKTPPPNVPTAMEKLLAKVEELERKDAENEKKLKMLYDVADKGRVFNYENSSVEKKPFKVKLSEFRNGIIVGWRTIKDELVRHPTTGLLIGEAQEYELLLLGTDGETTKTSVNGYPAFSSARYDNRVEAEVQGKKEDYRGNISYDVKLNDGRVISLDARFLN